MTSKMLAPTMSNSIFQKDGTAQGVAKQRLIESLAKPEKRVIYDPYAKSFVLGAGLIKLMGHKLCVWLTKKMAPGFHEHLIARTRFIDDLVEKKVVEGFTQYVILGAGYDLRAHRLKFSNTVKIFEVDQEEVQQKKQSKLPLEKQNLENLTYVSVDFNNQTIEDRLLSHGFNPTEPTIVTLEGVSQYITKEALESTLKSMIELTKKTKLIFYTSYVNRNLISDPKQCFGKDYPNPGKKAKMIMDLSAKVGEPWISLYSKEEIHDIFTRNGLSVIEDKTLSDLNTIYFEPVGRKLLEKDIFMLEHSIVAER